MGCLSTHHADALEFRCAAAREGRVLFRTSVAVQPVALPDAEPWVRAVGWPAARR